MARQTFSTLPLADSLPGFQFRHALRGHNNRVYEIAWAPNGQLLATGCGDWLIRLWDSQSGALRQRLRGHTDNVYSVQWSPDSQTLASGSLRELRLWDHQGGEPYLALQGWRYGGLFSVAWSPDGQTLAVGAGDHGIYLWDTQTQQITNLLKGHTSPILCVRFSPDGQTLASSADDDSVRLWSCNNGEALLVLDEAARVRTSREGLAFHPNGRLFATLGQTRNVVCIWDLDVEELYESLHISRARRIALVATDIQRKLRDVG